MMTRSVDSIRHEMRDLVWRYATEPRHLEPTVTDLLNIAMAYAAEQVAQARAEEREACANVASDYCTCEKLHAGHVGYHAKEIAAAIRARI